MKKTNLVGILIFLISILTITNADFKTMSFKELTTLASADLGKNIYLDKDLPKYSVQINLSDHQAKGEVYEYYKIVLYEHEMYLDYNRQGKFYYVRKREIKPVASEPALVHETLKLHYYTYKIKNITNEDVVKSMSIFPNVKFQYLKQSDIIAYSATRLDHLQVKRILKSSDNAVLNATIKISLFSVNKNNIEKLGASISNFGYGLNTKIFNDIIDSFRNGSSNSYDIFSTGFDIDFMFHALKGHSVVDIFQSPTMLLTNGVESVVTSVVNVPYLKTTSTVDSNTNSTVEQYDYKDIGLQIKVMPKIKKGLVYIDLNLVSDELITIEDDKPITQKITYTNSVRIKKGKPILLTGIKKTSQSFSKDGIPLLSDLPLLGALFRGTSTTTEEQNINILIEVL